MDHLKTYAETLSKLDKEEKRHKKEWDKLFDIHQDSEDAVKTWAKEELKKASIKDKNVLIKTDEFLIAYPHRHFHDPIIIPINNILDLTTKKEKDNESE